MDRRNFIQKTAAVTSLAGIGTMAFAEGTNSENAPSNAAKFKLKYAPAFEAFPESAGNNPIDVIKFCSDQGFRAMFDNGLIGRTPELQEKIAAELSRQKMDMGPFVLRSEE